MSRHIISSCRRIKRQPNSLAASSLDPPPSIPPSKSPVKKDGCGVPRLQIHLELRCGVMRSRYPWQTTSPSPMSFKPCVTYRALVIYTCSHLQFPCRTGVRLLCTLRRIAASCTYRMCATASPYAYKHAGCLSQERVGICGGVDELDAHNLGRQRLLKPRGHRLPGRFFTWCGRRAALQSTICLLNLPQLKLNVKIAAVRRRRRRQGPGGGGGGGGAAGGGRFEMYGNVCFIRPHARTREYIMHACSRTAVGDAVRGAIVYLLVICVHVRARTYVRTHTQAHGNAEHTHTLTHF